MSSAENLPARSNAACSLAQAMTSVSYFVGMGEYYALRLAGANIIPAYGLPQSYSRTTSFRTGGDTPYRVPQASLLRDLPRPFAQHVLPDLARGHARQVVDQHQVLGEFLPGQAGLVEEADDLGQVDGLARARQMTKAQPISPVLALGMATIATSATAGWPDSASSTSLGLMFSPERMMMSFERPVMTS